MEPSPNLPITDADYLAIQEVVSQAHKFQSDPPALLALHTSDVIVVNFPGRRVLGRHAFADAMTSALASPLSDVTTSVEILDIRLVTPDAPVVSCVKTVHDNRAEVENSTPLASTGSLTYLMTTTDAAWRIALAQTTPMTPSGGPGAPATPPWWTRSPRTGRRPTPTSESTNPRC